MSLDGVITELRRIGVPIEEIEGIVDDVIPEVIPFTKQMGFLSGSLSSSSNSSDIEEFGLSLEDKACIATGIINNMVIYTTKQALGELQIDNLNLVVIL